MRTADLLLLYDYHYWATHRILDKADAVTAEQFTSPTPFPMGSLHQTLVHTLATEIYLLDWWQEKPRQPRLTAEDLPDVAAIRARWRQVETELRAYLATLDENGLDRIVSHTIPRYGMDYTAPLWSLILHATYHGAQHRSEAAQMLTEYGQSPGNLDLPVFLNERGI
jgi:uncharacterized damage-inducible protein DinB